MKYTAFDEKQFHTFVNKALQSVEKILDVNRNPRIAEDQEHKYEDKYALAEFLTNTSIAAQMNILERMGLTEAKLKRLLEMVHVEKRSVTVCFEAEDSCTFLKEQMVDVVQKESEHVTEKVSIGSSMFGTTQNTESLKHKVVQKVREQHWKVTSQYRVYCYEGNDPLKNMNSIDLLSRSASATITTTGSRDSPFPSHTKHDPVRQDLTWILRNISEIEGARTCNFEINRTKKTCCTPRRNDDIDDAIYFFQTISSWFGKIRFHFLEHVEGEILSKHDPANPTPPTQLAPGLGTISDSQIFTPVLPLMEPHLEESDASTRVKQPKSLLVLRSPYGDPASPLLSLGDIDKFLNAQCGSLSDAMSTLTTIFPSHQLMKLVTVAEASLVLFSLCAISLFSQFQQSIEYVEEMLRLQLVAAIGKEIKADDFDRFMTFHNEKFFRAEFAPKPFSYAVRRPNHYPDGIVSIETNKGVGEKNDPIRTHVRHIAGGEDVPLMSIPINAATSLEMKGDRYLHGWVNHRFESSPMGPFALTARARQFSSFLLMVGVLGGTNKFEPKDAIIVQNKDEVLIPLLLNELPSAKDFKDAISSLSPEQQNFAKSFRGMQLESSVFAVCIVQLKPQLESLLGLPPGSLTKEIKLTQNLLSLFIDYQVPSDLLSFDGSEDASKADKVYCVKRHVSAVMDVIDEAKKAELEEMEQKAALQKSKLEAEKRFAEVRRAVAPTTSAINTIPPTPLGVGGQAYGGGQIHNPLSAAVVSSSHPTPAPAPMPFQELEVQEEAALEYDVSGANEAVNTSYFGSSSSPPSNFKSEDQGIVPMFSDIKSIDYTNIPKQLDSIFEKNDVDGSIRATTIETELPWKRSRPESLFSSPFNNMSKKAMMDLDAKACHLERNKAFDLLDALSRSGSLTLDFAELHVLVAVTHSFENDVMGTVIQDNVNPIEKVEKALLMVAGTIHGCDYDDSTLDKLIAEGPDRQRLLEAMDVSLLPPADGSGSTVSSNNSTALDHFSNDGNVGSVRSTKNTSILGSVTADGPVGSVRSTTNTSILGSVTADGPVGSVRSTPNTSILGSVTADGPVGSVRSTTNTSILGSVTADGPVGSVRSTPNTSILGSVTADGPVGSVRSTKNTSILGSVTADGPGSTVSSNNSTALDHSPNDGNVGSERSTKNKSIRGSVTSNVI